MLWSLGPAQAVAVELLPGVVRHRLEQRPLSPRWGTRIVHPGAAQQRQPLLVQLDVLGLDGHEHLLGHALRRILAVQVLEDPVDQRRRRQLLDLVEDEALAPDDTPAADVEHLHRRLELVVGEADDVEVLVAVGDHLLALDRPPHGGQAVAQARRLLELERPSAASRISWSRRLTIGVGVAVEEVAQLVDELAVRHLVDLADARPGALLDVEQQARPAEALVLLELRRAARADRERAQQLVERVADGVGVGVRPEVAGALALAPAHHQRPRELLVDGDGEERVALVVAAGGR